MKKKILVLVSLIFGAMLFAQTKSMQLELYADSEKSLEFSELDSKFEYVTLFYQDIFFNLNLLNSVNKDDLKNICIKVYENIKNGYKCQIVVKNFLDNQDLEINFGQFPDSNDNLLITTNYDKANNLVITNPDDIGNSWGLLYYLSDGKLIYYKNVDKPQLTAQEKLNKNLAELESNPKPIIYIMVVENYFEMNEIKKGLKYLKKNKKKAIELSTKTSAPGNINDVILCTAEEGRVFLKLK